MQEARDRVRLVDASEIGAREIQATVPRAEIEDVLRSKDGEPELVLDVTRGGEAEPNTLRLAWDPAELEALLRKADGDNVTFAFNGAELEQALADVEAHGLREAAVVVAVAATTAAAGAGVAQASAGPAVYQSGGSSVSATAPASAGGAVSERDWPQTVQSSVSERDWPQLVPGTAAQSSEPASTPSGVVSERDWPQVVNTSATSEREWPEMVGGTAPTSPTPVSADASSGTSVGSDAAIAGAVAGGAALMIGAAAFTVRRRGGGEPQPA
jgi:hypothetical protein